VVSVLEKQIFSTMIAVLTIVVVVLSLFVIYLMKRIKLIEDTLMLIDKEQHIQNMDINELLKYRNESSVVILQHSDILTYLMDRDPLLNKMKVPIGNIVGEA
jgi:predicted PurR-regulated permease PerM